MIAKMLAYICVWVAVASFVDAEEYFSVHGRQAFAFPNFTESPHSELGGTLAEESDREWLGDRIDMSRECKKQQRRYFFRPVSRIVKGDIVKYPENYPWMVSLHKGNGYGHYQYACGAVIVARRWILTAAHCLKTGQVVFSIGPGRCADADHQEIQCFLEARDVKFGYVTQQGEPAELMAEELYPSTKYMRVSAYDIALVKLKEKIPRDKYVPICLSKGRKMDYSKKNQPFLIGWGRTNEGAGRSPSLKMTSMNVDPAQECRRENAAPKTIICARAQNASSCWGDSGGPLSKVRNGITYLLGVLNGSVPSCPLNSQTVFARVSKYRQWIRKHIERIDQRRASTLATPF